MPEELFAQLVTCVNMCEHKGLKVNKGETG